MKVAAAVLVTTAPAPATLAGAGLVLGLFFLAVGMIPRLLQGLARTVPELVVAALQIGLGLSLAWIAAGRLLAQPWLAAALLPLPVLLTLLRPRWPVSLIVLGTGAAGGALLGAVPTGSLPLPHPTLPERVWPDLPSLIHGTVSIALPQIPLTLANAVLVTAAIGRNYFPHARGLVPNRLALTTGLANLVAAPIGGMPVCHGAGGLAAHHRFGARTWRAPTLLALILTAVGLGWGDGATYLLRRIPDAALGALLLVPALDLVVASRPGRFEGSGRVVLAVATVAACWSPGLAFVGAWPVVAACRRRGHHTEPRDPAPDS